MFHNANKYKVDLHTHSIISHDGALTEAHYSRLLEQQVLDYIAITDHNETRFARVMHEKLGDKIIVGEEITTTEGEIIGLFLQETIPAKLTPEDTVKAIHSQDGLVYIPHPFETFRKGLQADTLDRIAGQIEIIEVFNARGKWRGKNALALKFAEEHHIPMAASSDAHCLRGMGSSYSILTSIPDQKQFKKQLSIGTLRRKLAPLYTLLCPAINRIKNKLIV